MSRNVIIGGIVVIALAVGGWWYLNQSSVPTASETIPLPTSQETTTTQAATKASAPTTETQSPNTQSAKSEISFVTPAGYVMNDRWTTTGYDDLDARITVTKQEYLNTQTGPSEGFGEIDIHFYRNPQNLTPQQWAQVNGTGYGYGGQGAVETTYNFGDRTGLRFAPPSDFGIFVRDHIVVQHKGWMIFISNYSGGEEDSQNQAFNQLLSSVTFAK